MWLKDGSVIFSEIVRQSRISCGGVRYAGCISSCPCGYNWGTAASVLYTYNGTYWLAREIRNAIETIPMRAVD